MDEWLERFIRIANRQGTFSKRAQSPVQYMLLQLMMMLENRDENNRYEAETRSRLFASNPSEYLKMEEKEREAEALQAEWAQYEEIDDTELMDLLNSMRALNA